jgi:hypothetical protein
MLENTHNPSGDGRCHLGGKYVKETAKEEKETGRKRKDKGKLKE